jgi:hypothetical protein
VNSASVDERIRHVAVPESGVTNNMKVGGPTSMCEEEEEDGGRRCDVSHEARAVIRPCLFRFVQRNLFC